MDKEKFYEAVIEAMKNEIPEAFKQQVIIDVREINKTNDDKKMAVSVRLSPTGIAPMLYLDDFYEAYQDGESVEDIAGHILCMVAEAGMNAPAFETLSMDYENIADKLVMQMVEGDRNRERLRELVYRPIDNGMVMIPYIELGHDEQGCYRTAVTKDMAFEFDYDVDRLLDQAFANMIEQNEPNFYEMGNVDMILFNDVEGLNPMNADFTVEPDGMMYILTNRLRDGGASVLYYPGMQERIGELLGRNYYALPSSRHEVIILPDRGDHRPEDLKEIVKEANRTVVSTQDVLSDKVLYFDREKNKLYEPKGMERDGEERGGR